MKRLVLSMIAAGALAGATIPAFAQGPRASDWQPLSMRQAQIEQRIDQGVRSGQLTRREARGLRNEYGSLLRLEARYKSDGLSHGERADLQRRYDLLASRVRFEKHDGQTQYRPARR